MYCPNCGKDIPESSKFCLECGFKLDTTSDETPLEQEEYLFNSKGYICLGKPNFTHSNGGMLKGRILVTLKDLKFVTLMSYGIRNNEIRIPLSDIKKVEKVSFIQPYMIRIYTNEDKFYSLRVLSLLGVPKSTKIYKLFELLESMVN